MKLPFKKAAQKILEDSSQALTAVEITKIAIEKNMIDTSGETPEATMAAQIYVDIKNNKNSKFLKIGKGLFSVEKSNEDLASPLLMIKKQNEATKYKLKEILFSIDPYQFEYLVADLLQKIGYENVVVTKMSGDKGIDIVANLSIGGITSVKTVIQVKRYSVANKINGAVITQLRGSAEVDQRGLVITTSDFTKDAVEESQAANKMPVSLVNGSKLIELLIKYGIGVKSETLSMLSVDESYFQEFSTNDENLDGNEKNRSIWPLPGGTTKYIETLNKFLERVSVGDNSRKSLINWYLNEFDNVNSESTANGYINVPKNMGLIYADKEMLYLTPDGESYLQYKNLDLLYEIISKNILAFGDIYEFAKSTGGYISQEDILVYLKENFDIDWTTYAQVNFRVLWLINLNKLKKEPNGYIVA